MRDKHFVPWGEVCEFRPDGGLPRWGFRVRPHLNLSYSPPCGPFFVFWCGGAVLLVFRSFSEEIVPYAPIDSECPGEEVTTRDLPISLSWPPPAFFYSSDATPHPIFIYHLGLCGREKRVERTHGRKIPQWSCDYHQESTMFLPDSLSGTELPLLSVTEAVKRYGKIRIGLCLLKFPRTTGSHNATYIVWICSWNPAWMESLGVAQSCNLASELSSLMDERG